MSKLAAERNSAEERLEDALEVIVSDLK